MLCLPTAVPHYTRTDWVLLNTMLSQELNLGYSIFFPITGTPMELGELGQAKIHPANTSANLAKLASSENLSFLSCKGLSTPSLSPEGQAENGGTTPLWERMATE